MKESFSVPSNNLEKKRVRLQWLDREIENENQIVKRHKERYEAGEIVGMARQNYEASEHRLTEYTHERDAIKAELGE